MNAPALVVDKKGLAKKLAHKPKSFIIWELLQNALDEEVAKVDIKAEMLPGRPVCRIEVEDDSPDGFADLTSVYTMFKDSKKASDPTKRGRFELGEKLVIALAKTMTVQTTKGAIFIDGETRRASHKKRVSGSIIIVEVKMTRDEFGDMCDDVHMFIPPEGPVVTFNDVVLQPREREAAVNTTLQTIRVDDEGQLKPTQRKTDVHIYPTRPGEIAYLYEMGIPVVETGDKFHYDVQQRVPVNWERNNVPKSYLSTLRVAVLNELHKEITPEEATHSWVRDAAADKDCEADAAKTVFTKRFGEKTVIYDPSDPEANNIATSQGYTVIPGRSLSKGEWDHVKSNNISRPAGQVTPSFKPYSNDPNAQLEELVPEEKWSAGMKRTEWFCKVLFDRLVGGSIRVEFTKVRKFRAVFSKGGLLGDSRIAFSYTSLGKKWFDREPNDVEYLSLIIHEFGHYYSSNHLCEEYYHALTDLGAKLTRVALEEPDLFKGANNG